MSPSIQPLVGLSCLLALTAATAETPSPIWHLSTANTQISLGISNDQPVILRLENSVTRHNWAAQGVRVPLMSRVWVGGKEFQTQWRFKQGQLKPAGELTLTFLNTNPKLELRSIWRAQAGLGPVEHWMELENRTGERLTVSHQASLSLPRLRASGPAEVWWIKRGGSNASTQGGTFTKPLGPELDLVLVSNCDDGASPVPWMTVQVGREEGLYIGWEFSGTGVVEAKAGSSAQELDLTVGLARNFRTDIEPGETFLVPPAFVGAYAGEIDDGSYSLHRFVIEKLRPSVPADYPDPTLAYNLYLDVGGNAAKEADVLNSARTCYELGFETFMPDAMWFPETGDWQWDPKRFPRGIDPIEAYVHGKGMKLALWCAWSNGGISEDPEALSVRGPVGKPDWFNANYAADWKPGPFYGGRICLGCPEAKAWAIKKTQWLVAHHRLDYLKHDIGPIVTQCNKTTHRHKYGVDVGYWAALGYYEVQEKLRLVCPNVLLENCSGGGHIKDFGAMKLTHYIVTTDTLSNLPDRQSIYDSTFALPPLVLQAYTYEWEYRVRGDDPGPFLWRSAMMGAWQIDPTNTRKWTQEQRDSAKRASDIYKKWIRPMLKDVKVHHILPRPDGVRWDGMFYWSSGLKRGTLYIFRPDAEEESKRIKLKGLEANAKYWVWSEDGSVPAGERTGAELMEEGLAITLATRYSCDLIYLQSAALGKPEGLALPGEFHLDKAETASDEFNTSAVLRWEPSAGAKSYRVKAAKSADFGDALVETAVIRPEVTLKKLPPGRELYWKVEAISSGGKRAHDGPLGVFTTPNLKAFIGLAFASDMAWSKATAGANNALRRDSNYGGNTISLAGKPYPKGIWTHAFNDASPADVVIDIRGKGFGTFAAVAGVEDSAGPGTVQFQVCVDGQVKEQSPVLKAGSVHRFKVDVTQASQITLRVLNGGDGYNSDHAAWGFARFIEVGAKDPLTDR